MSAIVEEYRPRRGKVVRLSVSRRRLTSGSDQRFPRATMRLFIAALIVSAPLSLFASTGFHVGDGTSASVDMYAISTGWYYPVDAAAMVNGRSTQRTAELFGATGTPLALGVQIWKPQHQHAHAPGFPMSGMNEKGLVIQATILKDQVQVTGSGLVSTQWLQYQLDMSASVDEVIASAVTAKDPVVCLGTGKYNTQFEVCDTTQCARFAFYDGKATVQTSQARIERSTLATGVVPHRPPAHHARRRDRKSRGHRRARHLRALHRPGLRRPRLRLPALHHGLQSGEQISSTPSAAPTCATTSSPTWRPSTKGRRSPPGTRSSSAIREQRRRSPDIDTSRQSGR